MILEKNISEMDHQYSSSSSSTSDFQASKVNTEGSVGALCELNSSDVAESSRTVSNFISTTCNAFV